MTVILLNSPLRGGDEPYCRYRVSFFHDSNPFRTNQSRRKAGAVRCRVPFVACFLTSSTIKLFRNNQSRRRVGAVRCPFLLVYCFSSSTVILSAIIRVVEKPGLCAVPSQLSLTSGHLQLSSCIPQ